MSSPGIVLKYMSPLAAGSSSWRRSPRSCPSVNALLLSSSATLVRDLYVSHILRDKERAETEPFRKRAAFVSLFLAALLVAAWAIVHLPRFASVSIVRLNLIALGGLESPSSSRSSAGSSPGRRRRRERAAGSVSGFLLYAILIWKDVRPGGFLPVVPALLPVGIVFARRGLALHAKKRAGAVRKLFPEEVIMDRLIVVHHEFFEPELIGRITDRAAELGFRVLAFDGRVPRRKEKGRDAVKDAEILYAFSPRMLRAGSEKLKWFCCMSAGVGLVHGSVRLSEVRRYADEFRRLPDRDRRTRRHGASDDDAEDERLRRDRPRAEVDAEPMPIDGIHRNTFLIVGTGNLGANIASRLKGMRAGRVIGVNRSGVFSAAKRGRSMRSTRSATPTGLLGEAGAESSSPFRSSAIRRASSTPTRSRGCGTAHTSSTSAAETPSTRPP